MTAKLGRYRYWGDQKPDTSRPLLTVTRPREAVSAKATTTTTGGGESATSSTTGTLRIYGPIDSWGGWWGVSSKEVAQALDLLGDAEKIVVRVNSPGGESAEGRAIMNLLRAHGAEITTVVDGAAYSAASYIALAGSDRVMSSGSTFMIHDTSTYLYVNEAGALKAAEVLKTLSNSGAELYAEITGGTVEEWRTAMREESWYSAATAVEAGLMSRVGVVPDTGAAETAGDDGPEPVDENDVEERARATYDMSLFDKAPESITQDSPKPPSASAVGSTKTEGGSAVAFSDEQLTNLRTKLGLSETADEAAITAAVEAVVEESLEERPPATPTESVQVPEGHVVISAAELSDLKAGAALANATAKTLADKEREAFLDSVKGKFLPDNRDAWAKEFDRDPAKTREHFASAPVIIPTSEIGHAVNQQETAEDDGWFPQFPVSMSQEG